jgi:macrophage erythroblast attacher
MIARMRGVKRKLSAHADEEGRLHDQTGARIRHLDEMYSLHTYEDVKYEAWSRQRLDRLIADYFLRQGFLESARLLATERDMEKLVDVETFENMGRIRLALLDGSVVEALAWCQDNKKELRKMEVRESSHYPPLFNYLKTYLLTRIIQSKLEFMLRFQQYVELIRLGTQEKLLEAIAHAKKWLIPFRAQYPKEVQQACGLLAMPPTASNAACYANVYKPRWQELADLFTTTHNQLLSLPSVPLLHIALSSGLSALKTPACHAHQQQQEKQEQEKKTTTAPGKGGVTGGSSGNDDDTDGATITSSGPGAPIVHDTLGQGLCPICSTELNDLARYVPYAHHTKSHVQPDLVMLPSRKARSRQLLLDEAKKAGLEPDMVRDPVTQSLCHVDELKKVYIT